MTKPTSPDKPPTARETNPDLTLQAFLDASAQKPLIDTVDRKYIDQIRNLRSGPDRNKIGVNTVVRWLREVGYRCSSDTVKQLLRDVDAGK
jgi:hypothetical protein